MQSRVVSYQRRGGRMGPQLRQAFDHDLPALLMPTTGPWNLQETFPNCDRFVLEIGSGMGEATLAMAQAEPDTGLIAVEVHDRGVAALVRGICVAQCNNVRIHMGDAVLALRELVSPESLDEVRIWFPDPWPKARHHKRRLVTREFLELVVSRLSPAGRVHVATDHADYADVIADVLAADTRLLPALADGPRPDWRPWTKFERAGQSQGRRSHDFIYVRGTDTIATEPLRR